MLGVGTAGAIVVACLMLLQRRPAQMLDAAAATASTNAWLKAHHVMVRNGLADVGHVRRWSLNSSET